jgi:hypothetical protein
MRRFFTLLLLPLSFAASGCSDEGAAPRLYPVTGKVVVGGKPLEGITVQLTPIDPEKARPGLGVTDAEGKFAILTNGDKGAASGKYKVVLVASSGARPAGGQASVEDATKAAGQMMERMAQAGGKPVTAEPTLPFPKEWGNAGTTPKEVEVGTQAVVVNIDI